jgi:hypothetical protein
MTDELSKYLEQINSSVGAERIIAFIAWSNFKEGYYTPDELINLALENSFNLDNPLSKIRRGTQISVGTVIKNGSIIDGSGVVIGEGSVLDKAHITASDVVVGKNNLIRGILQVGHLKIGNENKIFGLTGNNPTGQVSIGDHNSIQDVIIENGGESSLVRISHYNNLQPGLTISNPFPNGRIKIGNYNRLGDGGGAVITSSYRFARGWGGAVVIGSHVEMTRGAELCGLCLAGWSPEEIEQIAGSEAFVQKIFKDGQITDVIRLLERFWKVESSLESAKKNVGIYGVAKLKRTCLVGRARVRDDVRTRCAYLRNVEVRERCNIYYSVISPPEPIEISVNGRAVEGRSIFEDQDWKTYPTDLQQDSYPKEDYDYYEASSE